MPAKYVPSDDELKKILDFYAAHKTYTSVSREFGISVPIATRIIKEAKSLSSSSSSSSYDGPQPVEFPDQNSVLHFYNPGKEWLEDYAERV